MYIFLLRYSAHVGFASNDTYLAPPTLKGQHMNMSTLCTIKYMNRSYFSRARYMIGIGFKILGRTPVPKLPPSYPPPPPRVHNGLRNVTGFNKTWSETRKKSFDCAAANGYLTGWEGGDRRKLGTAFHMP